MDREPKEILRKIEGREKTTQNLLAEIRKII
jgi:hypothetical protein